MLVGAVQYVHYFYENVFQKVKTLSPDDVMEIKIYIYCQQTIQLWSLSAEQDNLSEPENRLLIALCKRQSLFGEFS